MDRAWASFLQRVPIFGEFDQEELERLAPLFARREYCKGEIVFMKGDPGDAFYVIEEGTVKIYVTTPEGGEKTLAILGAGEFFGEMALLDGSPRSAIAEALERCELRTLQKRDFTGLLMEYPAMSLKIIRVLCDRLRRMNAHVESLTSQDARSRILGVLRELAERNGRDVPAGRRIELRLTHQQLASIAGTSRETVTRLVSALQEEGILALDGRRIVLKGSERERARPVDLW